MTAEPEPTGSKAAAALHVTRLVARSAPWHLLVYLVLTLVGGVLPIAVAWLTKLTLDRLAVPSPGGIVLALAAGLASVGVTVSFAPQLTLYVKAELDRRAGLRAKDDLFRAVERFGGLSRFEDPVFVGRLRMAQQSASASGHLVQSVLGLAQSAVTLVGFTVALAAVNPWFNAVILASAVPAFVIELRLSRQRAAMLWDIGPAERRELFYGELLSSVEAAKEVRLLGLGPFLRGRMTAELRRSNDARRRVDRRELVRQGTLSLLAAAIAGAGLVWTVTAAARGALTVGDVALFVASVAGVRGAVDGLVDATSGAHHELLLFGHYRAVVGAVPDLPEPARPRALPALREGVELRDVWFRYSEEHPWVLRGVDLFIPHGRSVALVGLNGSGKSTIVKLLCRFYDPDRGSILWDGVDLRDVPVDELRSRIGSIFQDFMAYDLSAAENIAVGDLTALDDRPRLEEAARRAGVHEIVEALPRGYETLLTRIFLSESEDAGTGVVLSGGQWQRLALARAYLRVDRDLLILDEPGAGLDAEAEHDMHTRLGRARSGRTSLLISHRLGAIRDADLIAVLAEGRVSEQGGHAALLAAGGTYARLFRLQAAGYADAAGAQGGPG